MIDTYAITTDGGRSWSKWKVNENLIAKYPSEFLIKEVLVNHDGSGTLVAVSRSANNKPIRFRTQDFGQSWIPLESSLETPTS
jgi:photosystem II stability/assembly factor-like uncharacterized protein